MSNNKKIFVYKNDLKFNDTFDIENSEWESDAVKNIYDDYNIIKGTIFISIASYRDPECSLTIDSIYKNAEFPNRIYIGICEQNKQGSLSESCLKNKYNDKYNNKYNNNPNSF